jgi:rod shape-determining protein MreD
MKAFRFSLSPKDRLRDRFRKRINRAPSPLLALSVPWASIMLGSLAPSWIVIASAPLLPPLGFLMLVAWRQLRPGLLPVWVGLPLGLFDDLYSGQPLGNAVLLWSLAVIVLDVVEARLPWRNFLTEWLMAAALITGYIVLGLGIANLGGGASPFQVIVPQVILSIFFYPLVGRLVAVFDRFRLLPFRKVG